MHGVAVADMLAVMRTVMGVAWCGVHFVMIAACKHALVGCVPKHMAQVDAEFY